MLEEVRDLRELDLRQVARRFDRPVQGRQLVGRHGEDLRVAARLVVHLQHADGRQRTTTPVISGTGDSTSTSHGSPSSDSVWGM